ncbi:hypothetical protein G7B40_029195 [Aetokthonos hydrillicola Thurmond2011]|uniref:Uncharacterized protein n=1 Tax=Aetokthonos hydrillicola Thurmond2011 TaxID=2712845 RepID=A0AAP5ICF8_9CYAN|nr:hypothetical protein [Aetokthonos hydrillicola Thurmond2011]
MHNSQLFLIASYLLITCYFFSTWLRFSLRHPSSQPEDIFLSFVMFVVTTIFWPLLLPVSLIDIFKTRKFALSNVVPVLVAVSAFSLALYIR